jgi:hypothetical protein
VQIPQNQYPQLAEASQVLSLSECTAHLESAVVSPYDSGKRARNGRGQNHMGNLG